MRLKSLGILNDDQYKKIKAVRPRPDILYGLCKVHKTLVDVCPNFRTVFSATRMPTYKIAKFLVPIHNCLTINEFTIKDFCLFAKKEC